MEDFTQLYSSHGRGLELFAKQRSRPAPVVDMTAWANEVGTTSRNIYAPGSFRTYFSHVGNYLAFAKATNAPHDAGCPPGVPVTFQVLLNYFVWYVALKPNQRHPNQPHAASTLHVMMAAIKSAALADSWCRNEANAEAFGGVPGFAITLGDRHVLNGVIRALAKLHPTDDADRKLPMRMAYLQQIRSWYKLAPSWERMRDLVWQSVGHQGMLRVGELIALHMRDILVIRDALGSVVAVQVKIVTSKTADHTNTATGGAQLVTLAKREDDCDAVGPLLDWMRESGALTEGDLLVTDCGGDLLFPSSRRGKVSITKEYVSETLRAGLLGIGLDPSFVASFSGRSLRAGGATDMRDSGVDWHVIVLQGRWRSDAWKVYFRDSPDVVGHLLKLRPVALDALRHLPPSALAEADATARSHERLPQLPQIPAGVALPVAQLAVEEVTEPATKRRALAAPHLQAKLDLGVATRTPTLGVPMQQQLSLPSVTPESDQLLMRSMLERAHGVVYDPSLPAEDWSRAEKVMKSLERVAHEAQQAGLSLVKTEMLMLAAARVDTQLISPSGNVELTTLGISFSLAIKGSAALEEVLPVIETVTHVDETVEGAEEVLPSPPMLMLVTASVSVRKSGRSTMRRWSKHGVDSS